VERCLQTSEARTIDNAVHDGKEGKMNRKLGQLIKATLFALPFALPGVALAQSADTTPGTHDTANKGALQQENSLGNGTMDNTDKQNAGSLGTSNPQDTSGTSKSDLDRKPQPGSVGTSGSSSTSDRSVGGDINKANDDTPNMNSDSATSTKQKKTKKTVKPTTSTDFNNDSTR
jgi:hypothetical protein